MKLYRYLTEEELNDIKANNIENIGSFYNSKNYKKINTHHYKKDVRYLHFYFDKKEIARIDSLGFKGSSVCYICEFEIPFYVIFKYIGIGYYESHGYQIDTDSVFEVALPVKKFKQKYLTSYEKDKNSGPVDFGPIIKFDKRLFYDDVCVENIKNEPKRVPLAIKAIEQKLEECEERQL